MRRTHREEALFLGSYCALSAATLLLLPGLVQAFPVGDLNCDGLVNSFDIDPFVLAVTDSAAYAAAYPACDYMLGDINGDGLVNSFDIDPFVVLLTSTPEGACCFYDGSCSVLTEADLHRSRRCVRGRWYRL